LGRQFENLEAKVSKTFIMLVIHPRPFIS
jgi:hypothetical protein